MFTNEEKILILGALFHDIGKFKQRCYSNILGRHEELGEKFIEELKEYFIKILDGNNEQFVMLKSIIRNHHSNIGEKLNIICRNSDHLSASERVEKADNEEPGKIWQHQFLSSIFSKIRLLNEDKINLRYYKHELLTKKNYQALIPTFETKEDALFSKAHYRNQGDIFLRFTEDIKSILTFYKGEDDFNTLINLILILFEKYMWCIPDFTGSPETDISLYNHVKDVAAISHAIYLNDNLNNRNLALIIGDMPGIQNYIFDVVNKKPAKILRGRSIYVQILTRIFASIFLQRFKLTECNLIMLAGGKFYIIAPSNKSFEHNYKKSIDDIEKYLAENFFYEIKFSAGYEIFNYDKLKSREITFGEIIDKASLTLLNSRHQLFKNSFINTQDFNFILSADYFKGDGTISDRIKCSVTNKPIRKGRDRKIKIADNEEIIVDKQVQNEFEIGNKITRGTTIIELNGIDYEVKSVTALNNNLSLNSNENKKIILNPDLDELINYKGNKESILKDSLFIEVANYCSFDDNSVMDFNKIIKKNNGAEVLTLIKGDIDELGLIMSCGLTGNKGTDEIKDYTSISRTTTLSNHLKYFFSFFVNGFLESWDISNRKEDEIKENNKDQYVYTIFAGGDDIMLISPQSASLKLLQEFNKQFTDFVCENPEIHISNSLTNFKDSTPIRIVAEQAEQNQGEVKNVFKNLKMDSFVGEKNKAGTMIFNTPVKNNSYKNIIDWANKISDWVKNDKNPVSKGTLYNLLTISKIINSAETKKDYSRLLWHPIITHYINRVIKNKKNEYKVEQTKDFFELVLSLNKENFEAKELKKILQPLVCEVIYKTRKLKKESYYD